MLKRFHQLGLVLAATVVFAVVPLKADTIAGSTTGCFASPVNGNAVSCSTTSATDAGITFTGGSFDVGTIDNFEGSGLEGAGIGGGSNNLGTLSLGSESAIYDGDTFDLTVNLTDPASGTNTVDASLLGEVVGVNGGVTITFTNPTDLSLTNGDTLILDVNPVSVYPGSGSVAITGTAVNAPEASSLLMLSVGLLGVIGLGAFRRHLQPVSTPGLA